MQFRRTIDGTRMGPVCRWSRLSLNGGMVCRSACTVSHVRIFNDTSRFRCTRWEDDEAKARMPGGALLFLLISISI